MRNIETINNAISRGYDFSIGKYVARGWDLFKSNAGGFIGYTFLFIIITMTISLIPLLGFLIMLVIYPTLVIGTEIVGNLISKGQYYQFGDFFKGFDKLGNLLITYVLRMLVMLVIFIPFGLIIGFTVFKDIFTGKVDQINDPLTLLASLGLPMLVMMLIGLYVTLSLRWAFYLVYFYNLEPVDALMKSWKLINKRFFSHLGLVIIFGLITILGTLMLGIGLLVAMPVILLSDYVAFEDVTGLVRERDEEDEMFETGEGFL